MLDELIEMLKRLNQNLEDIKRCQNIFNLEGIDCNDNLPKIIYAKEIAEKYQINRNKATDFCKRYGTNFGGYCIEVNKFREILQTKGIEIFD